MPARRVDPKEFALMYMRGDLVAVIAARFGVVRNAVKYNRKILNLPARPKGWRPKR